MKKEDTRTFKKDPQESLTPPDLTAEPRKDRKWSIGILLKGDTLQPEKPTARKQLNSKKVLLSFFLTMSDRREEQNKGERIILESAADYPKCRSYTISKLQEKNCHCVITGKPRPTRESVHANLEMMGFSALDFTAQGFFNTLSSEIEKWEAAKEKGEGIIRKTVAHKHHPILENKTGQEMWEILKVRFQNVSPMSITRRLLEAIKIKLSDSKSMEEYTSAYREAYDDICNVTTEDSEMTTKAASMLLQGALLSNMGPEYAGIASTIESQWKARSTNLQSTILRLIKYEEIRKGSSEDKQTSQPTILLTSSNPPKPRAPKGTCTFPDCVKRGITSHFIENCYMKHPELRPARPKYSLRQMKTKGSKTNLRSEDSPPSTPTGEAPTTREA